VLDHRIFARESNSLKSSSVSPRCSQATLLRGKVE
jgi:hypothetical protein